MKNIQRHRPVRPLSMDCWILSMSETACTDKIANSHSYGDTEAGHICVNGAVLSVLWTWAVPQDIPAIEFFSFWKVLFNHIVKSEGPLVTLKNLTTGCLHSFKCVQEKC